MIATCQIVFAKRTSKAAPLKAISARSRSGQSFSCHVPDGLGDDRDGCQLEADDPPGLLHASEIPQSHREPQHQACGRQGKSSQAAKAPANSTPLEPESQKVQKQNRLQKPAHGQGECPQRAAAGADGAVPCILARGFVGLVNAESVALEIEEVALPAGAWNGEFRQGNTATEAGDGGGGLVKILDQKRADKGVGAAFGWRCGGGTLKEAAAPLPGVDATVGNRQFRSQVEAPAKHLSVKMCRPGRIGGLDFEIHVVLHEQWEG